MPIVKFGDVVKRANTKEDRFTTEKLYYVGGEHMETGEYLIRKKGLIAGSNIGPMFYCGFVKGQVLLASRSPDLKKAGMVTFDGLCSEKTFVIETKDENVLLQSFLPAIVRSEAFWKYANDNQSGSVNHFINWSTFANYEFFLPPVEQQRTAANLLWAMERVKAAYKDLISKTDALVKSQFIEMFGDVDNTAYEVATIGEMCKLKSGTTFPADQELEAGDYLYAKVSDMNLPGNEVYMRFSKAHVSASTAGSTPIPAGAVIFPKRGGAIGTNKKRILEKDTCVDLNTMGVIPGERLLTEYLYQFFINTDLMSLADGSTIPQLNNRQIAPVRIIVPPFDKQEAFRDIFQQSDKSKFEAKQALDSLTAAQKALMRQYLKQEQ